MYQSDWSAIAARISGIARSGDMLAVAFSHSDSDGGVITLIKNQLAHVRVLLRQFLTAHAEVLPDGAKSSISAFLSSADPTSSSASHRTALILMQLVAVESEVSYYLVNSEKILRDATVVAFRHLQRLIAIDPDITRRWREAFAMNEVACERLATHLLWHGILAFKVDSAGARTDLVFGEPITEEDRLVSAARGLVLTEWKLVRRGQTGDDRAEEARHQTVRYATGNLMGTELRSRRFVVLVSDKEIPDLPDITEGVVTWEHIVICVNPTTPSVAAKRGKVR